MMVIPNGVKLASQIETSQVKSVRARLTSQAGPEDILFLFVGHDFQRKGLACLIEAMGLLQKKDNRTTARLIVAGRANPTAYQRLAVKLNIEDKIVFLGGVDSIQELIAATDVAVLPTFDDPCSRFILEALAAGKPVITTLFNGATDLFMDNRHGRVVDDPRNTDALCESLEFFTNRDNLGRAENAIVKDNLRSNVSVARVAGQLNDVYESVLKKRSG
jgi:UDP-glucose:(heptosyl)LPS alpha-1,3-glucosyltransferase